VPPQREQQRPMSKKCVDIPPEAEYQDNLDLVMVVNIHKYCKVRVRKCSAIHWENVGSSSRNDSPVVDVSLYVNLIELITVRYYNVNDY